MSARNSCALPAAAPTASAPSVTLAYRQHARTVARWARQLSDSDAEVEDIVQEVFLAVSRQLNGFRGEARLTTWLFQITRRIAIRHLRRQRARQGCSSAHEPMAKLPWPGRDPLAELERRQTGTLLCRALDQLPEKYRAVLVLHEIQGVSTREIAGLQRSKLATTHVHLHRAREKLLGCYQDLVGRDAS